MKTFNCSTVCSLKQLLRMSSLTANQASDVTHTNEAGLLSDTATDAVIPSEEATDAVLPSEEATNAVLPSEEATNAVLPSEEVTNAVLPSEEATNAVLPSEEATNAVLPSEEVTNAVQPSAVETNAVIPSEEVTNAAQPLAVETNAVIPSEEVTNAVQPSAVETNAVIPSEEVTNAVQLSAVETNAVRELRTSDMKRLQLDKIANERKEIDEKERQIKANALEKIRRVQELEEAKKAQNAAVAEYRHSCEGTLVAYRTNPHSLTMEDYLRLISYSETSKEIQTTCTERILALTNEKNVLIESLTKDKSELKSQSTSFEKQLTKAIKQIEDYGDKFAENSATNCDRKKKTSKKAQNKTEVVAATEATAATAATEATAATAPTAPPAQSEATAATAVTASPAQSEATAPQFILIMNKSVKTHAGELKKLEDARDASKQRLSNIGDEVKSLDGWDVSDAANALHNKHAAERDVFKAIMSDIKAKETLVTTLEALIMCVQTATRIDIACDAMKNFMEMTQSVAGTNTLPSAPDLVAGTNTLPFAHVLASARDPYPTLAEAKDLKSKPSPPVSSGVKSCTPTTSTMVHFLTPRPNSIKVTTQPESKYSAKVTIYVPKEQCPIDKLGCVTTQSKVPSEGLCITSTMREFLNQVAEDNAPLSAQLILLKPHKKRETALQLQWNLRACYVDSTNTLVVVVVVIVK